MSEALVHEARTQVQQDPNHPLWTRGLLPLDAFPKVSPVKPELWEWFRNNSEGIISGQIYTDGAMKARWWWRASERAGWGVAMMRGKRLVTGFYGHLAGPIQSVPRAELTAVVAALQVLIKPAVIHTDHFNLITDIRKSLKATCSGKHQHADLWVRFWNLIEEHGGPDSQLQIV